MRASIGQRLFRVRVCLFFGADIDVCCTEKRKSPMAAHHGVTTRQDIEESDRRYGHASAASPRADVDVAGFLAILNKKNVAVLVRIKRLRQALAQTKIAVKAVQADTKAVVESDEQRMQWYVPTACAVSASSRLPFGITVLSWQPNEDLEQALFTFRCVFCWSGYSQD